MRKARRGCGGGRSHGVRGVSTNTAPRPADGCFFTSADAAGSDTQQHPPTHTHTRMALSLASPGKDPPPPQTPSAAVRAKFGGQPSRVPRSPCIPPPAPSTRGFSPLQRHLPTVPQSAQTTARLGMRGPGPPRCPPRCPAEGLGHAARRPGAIPAPACSVCGECMKGWGDRSWKGGDRPRRAT